MLLYFLLGMIFSSLLTPILDSITRYVCTVFEHIGTKLAVKTQKIANELEERPPVVGFIQPDDNYEEEDEDED